MVLWWLGYTRAFVLFRCINNILVAPNTHSIRVVHTRTHKSAHRNNTRTQHKYFSTVVLIHLLANNTHGGTHAHTRCITCYVRAV